MTAALDNRALTVATRLIVGSVFVFASIEKTADPVAFAAMIDHYRIIGGTASLLSAMLLPWLELVAGITLILGVTPRGASLLIGSMTILFTAAILSGIARGLDIGCGCYTLDPDVSRIGWGKVAENVGLVILSVYLVISRAHGWSVMDLSFSRDSTNP
jgi:uncharacterized membrane protein YphA (DoxX/SURF4 family)